MSTRKILGTAACMVIIGVSAGVSYGQFQRLTAQVAPTPLAVQAGSTQTLTPAPTAGETTQSVDFVAASTTTWTAAEKSGVVEPLLVKPVPQVQPEPPLQQFVAVATEDTVRTAPTLSPGIAALADPILEQVAPDAPTPEVATTSVAAAAAVAPGLRKKPVTAEKLGFSTASTAKVTPGTLRRFRAGSENQGRSSGRDGDGSFEQIFPPATALTTVPRAARTGVRASTRAVQRQARFQRTWSTGVYR